MIPDTEASDYVEHAVRNAENLRTAAGFIRNEVTIRESVVTEFVAALAARVGRDLGSPDEGWHVWTRLSGGELAEEWGEIVTVTRDGWPGGPKPSELLRVAVVSNNPGPKWLYFSVRQTSRPRTPDPVAERIAGAAALACGRSGGGVIELWPYWYRTADRFTHWTDWDVLVSLKEQQEALDYFSDR